MGQAHFHGYGKVYDGLAFGSWLPDVKYRIANLQGVFRLGSREAFRAVFEAIIIVSLGFGQFLQKLRPRYGDVLDLLLIFVKDLFALGNACRVVHMDNHGRFAALESFEGLLDDMFARLREHLNGDIFGNHVLLDEGSR